MSLMDKVNGKHTYQSLIYQLALTKVSGIGNIIARQLLDQFGNETNIFESDKQTLLAAGVSPKIIANLKNTQYIEWAKKEAEFISENNITPVFITAENYPVRLRECADAPILLYYKGNANLNASKIISIVGTRSATEYSINFCSSFLRDLAELFPELIVVSGLAYGVDIHAHKAALNEGLQTIAVVAHGHDRIYPSIHKKTATQMYTQGGILSEFPSNTPPDKYNFIRRNRIVAGMADAVIVLESAHKGGSLITAEIASSYYRDVFALPGRTGDTQSEGCNLLIVENKASLLQSAETFVRQMGWGKVNLSPHKAEAKQLTLNLSDEEEKIFHILQQQELHIDFIAIESGIPITQLSSILLEMEMRGVIQALPGNRYRLA